MISEILRTATVAANPAANPFDLAEPAILTTRPTFQINSTKPYVVAVIFSLNNDIKFLEITKERFKKGVFWNRCRFERTKQLTNNNLD